MEYATRYALLYSSFIVQMFSRLQTFSKLSAYMHFTQLQVVRCVANYGIFHGRWDSPAGRNALHCMYRYSATLSDVSSPKFESLVWEHATKDISIQQEQSVDLLRECIMIRDNGFTLPDFYTVADVQSIILYICSLG